MHARLPEKKHHCTFSISLSEIKTTMEVLNERKEKKKCGKKNKEKKRKAADKKHVYKHDFFFFFNISLLKRGEH